MKYSLIRHRQITYAASHSEFVKWMRSQDKLYWENNREFMEGYSYRKYYFEKILIRYDSEKEFVEDLVQNELLLISGKHNPIRKTTTRIKNYISDLFTFI